MTSFTSSRVNKEWLSMHQCIDENCPVHSCSKVHPLSGVKRTLEDEISNKNFDKTREINCYKFNPNKHTQNPVKSKDKDIETCRQNVIKSIDLSLTIDGNEREPSTGSLNNNKTDENVDISRNECPSKEVFETNKPRFICTWLNNNVDIRNFPFYRKAVYYGNQRTVRKDFALYSSNVTNHIWKCHKYIGESKPTDNTSDSPVALVARSKASRSREDVSETIETVTKSIPEVNISDLKLKYAFLFSPILQLRKRNRCRSSEDKYPYDVKDTNLKQKGIMPTGGSCHHVCTKTPTTIGHSGKQNGDHGVDYPKSLCFSQDADNTYSNTKPSHDISDIQFLDYLASVVQYNMGNTKQRSHGDNCKNKNGAETYCVYKDFSIETDSTNYNNEITSPSESYSSPHTYTHASVNVPLNAANIQCKESSNNPYSLGAVSEEYSSQTSCPNIQAVSPSYSTYANESNSQVDAYYNVSPLVTSATFSHYMTPVQQSIHPTYGGQTFHFYTKRNEDPRLRARGSADSDFRFSGEQRCANYNNHSLNLGRFLMTSENSNMFNIRSKGKLEHGADQGRRIKRRKRQDRGQSDDEDEDPLYGLHNHKKTVRQISPKVYFESSDSEIFNNVNEGQGDEDQYANDLLDKFHADKPPHRKHSRYYSKTVSSKYRTRSPVHKEDHDLLCYSQSKLRDRLSRDRLKTRERTSSTCRFSSSQRFRRSKSSSVDRRFGRFSNNSRHPRSHKSHERHTGIRISSVLSSELMKSAKTNKQGMSVDINTLRELSRHRHNYRHGYEYNRNHFSETPMSSRCSVTCSRSARSGSDRLFDNNYHKSNPITDNCKKREVTCHLRHRSRR